MIKDSDNQDTRIFIDSQTNRGFPWIPEEWFDIVVAWITAAYSVAVMGYCGWLMLDTWSGKFSSRLIQPYHDLIGSPNSNAFKLVVYTAIGGAMGAAIDNIRSVIQWHSDRQGFSWRYLWKHISLPFVGAILAVLAFGILRTGGSIIGAEPAETKAITSFSAWVIGTLAGYGAHQVFKWLDEKMNEIFKVKTVVVTVPDLSGKTLDQATQLLIEKKLAIGYKSKRETTDPQKNGLVIWQSPPAGEEIIAHSEIAVTLGTPSDGTNGKRNI